MNRYLVRSLVAILTFSIGVAVGSIFRAPTPTYRKIRHKRCNEFVSERRVINNYVALSPSPSVAIDSTSTDPLKLRYARTSFNPTGVKPQLVEFTVESTSRRPIANFTISYRSKWPSRNQDNGAVAVTYHPSGTSSLGKLTFDNVVVECDVDETLSAWVSAVEFRDGSSWTNPRQPFN